MGNNMNLRSLCKFWVTSSPWFMPKSYPLECKSIATSNNMKLVHWPVLHLVQRGEDWVGTRKQGTGGAAASPSPPPALRCTKCNSLPINGQCTNHRIVVEP